MKTKVHLTAALLVCVAYIACSCTPTTTWRQIRSDPQRYVAEEVSLKGEVSGVYWDKQSGNGGLALRDRNGDTGRVELPMGKALPDIGFTVAVTGDVLKARNEAGSELYVLADHCGRRINWSDFEQADPVFFLWPFLDPEESTAFSADGSF